MAESSRSVGRDVVRREAEALTALAEKIGPEFDDAVERILGCTGRVILCGMGKSGQIAQKIASTMVSTGTLASFLHPAEGVHGDIGIVTRRDLVIAISNSGTTKEVLGLLPTFKSIGAGVIAMTGPRTSPLAREADVALCWGDLREADPLGVVPTVSAALTLALGDALTVAVMTRRGFDAKDYALVHPSGAIGRKLTLRVADLLRGPSTNPTVAATATFGEALETVTRFTLGGVAVVDAQGALVGLLTDGDVRRTIATSDGSVKALLSRPVSDFMTKTPTTVRSETLALEALRVMETHRPHPVFLVPVVDAAGKAVGMLQLNTIVQAGFASGKEEG
jgi:arabinose-5-phosphate isomerase